MMLQQYAQMDIMSNLKFGYAENQSDIKTVSTTPDQNRSQEI